MRSGNSHLELMIGSLAVRGKVQLCFRFCFATQGIRGTALCSSIGPSTLKCVLQKEIIGALYLFRCLITK